MKKITQIICLIIVLSTCLSVSVFATETPTPWASSYFGARSAYLWKTSNTQFQVWFDVTAVSGMSELGTSTIKVQKSTDNSNWSTVQTYTKDAYASMVGHNTGDYCSYVTYSNATSGNYYRAYVEFYAKNSSGGRGYYDYYTASIYIP